MVTEKDIKKELIRLMNLVDEIKEPIICKNGIEINELSHELSRKIHDKIRPDTVNIVEFS